VATMRGLELSAEEKNAAIAGAGRVYAYSGEQNDALPRQHEKVRARAVSVPARLRRPGRRSPTKNVKRKRRLQKDRTKDRRRMRRGSRRENRR